MGYFVVVMFLITVAAFFILSRHKEPSDLSGQVQDLSGKYNPDMNRVAAWNEKQVAKARTDLALQLGLEANAVVSLRKAQTEVLRTEHETSTIQERLEEVRDQERAMSRNTVALLEKATELNTIPELLTEIRGEEEKAKIRVDEHREMKEIDKEVYKFEKEIDVKGAIIARVAPIYEVNLLTEQLSKALSDREMLLLEPDSDRKKKMLKRLDKNVKLLNEAIDAKGQGLIQGDNRLQLGAMDED